MDEISTNRIKLSQLRTLVTIAECGNFSEAALRLEITQSAVSHAIASLESELGVPLFARGRHGALLTSVGERILVHAREVLQLLQKIGDEATLERGLQSGRVRIASFRSVSTHVLPSVIAQFRDRYPKITVTITEHFDYEGVEQALREGRADLGFTYLPTTDEFESWEILHDDYIALLPPNAQLPGWQIGWQQLADYPLITSEPNNACNAAIRQYLRSSPYPIKIAYEVREDSTIVSMVMQGLGAAIIPRLAAEPLPAGVRVYSLPSPFERIIGVAVLDNVLHSPAVFAFVDSVREAGQQWNRSTVTVGKCEYSGNNSTLNHF